MSQGVPLKWSISLWEQNCDPAEELPRDMVYPDKYPLRQYLVDDPDPELTIILRPVTYQRCQ
jgi:hypothetical protein